MTNPRIFIRKADGTGEFDGSLPSETYYPAGPNVDVDWSAIDTEPAEFDLSDGFNGEDLRAIGDAVGAVAGKVALGAAGAGIALGGVSLATAPAASAAQVGVSQVGGSAAAEAFSARLATNKTASVTAAKTAACRKAEKKVVTLTRKDAPKKVVTKAKKKAVKQCKVTKVPAGALPAGASGWNLDGSVRYEADFFDGVTTPGKSLSANEQAAYAAAIEGVSGENWKDQSDLPADQRVGLPPGAPSTMISAVKSDARGAGVVFQFANATSGDVFDYGARGSFAVTETAQYVTSGDATLMSIEGVFTDGTTGRTEVQTRFVVAMPDGTIRASRVPHEAGVKPPITLNTDGSVVTTGAGGAVLGRF